MMDRLVHSIRQLSKHNRIVRVTRNNKIQYPSNCGCFLYYLRMAPARRRSDVTLANPLHSFSICANLQQSQRLTRTPTSHINSLKQTATMDVFYYYNYGTAAWLALQAAPLIISPHMITTMLSPEVREATSKTFPFTVAPLQLRPHSEWTWKSVDTNPVPNSSRKLFLPHARLRAHRPRRPDRPSYGLSPADVHIF